MYERATFSSKGSCEDKFLGNWLKFMMKTGSEKLFPNTATASNTIEIMRILMRSRQGVVRLTLTLAVVWEQIRAAYLSTSGAGSEDVSEALRLLSDPKTSESFDGAGKAAADKNRREGAAQNGLTRNGDEIGFAEMKQELAEARKTIAQLRKNQAPYKRQRSEGWTRR